MIEPKSKEELGLSDKEYKIYYKGFVDGSIKTLEKSIDDLAQI